MPKKVVKKRMALTMLKIKLIQYGAYMKCSRVRFPRTEKYVLCLLGWVFLDCSYGAPLAEGAVDRVGLVSEEAQRCDCLGRPGGFF